MVLGLATYTWDAQKGPVLEMKHPDDVSISDNDLTKLILSQSVDAGGSSHFSFTETTINQRSYWIVSDLTRSVQGSHEIAILVHDPGEKITISKMKPRFFNFARLYFKFETGESRRKFFNDSLNLFFNVQSKKKVLLVGRAATGKTSMKQVIFEGKDPEGLLRDSIDPTLDLDPSIHSWLDLSVGVFDSSGQEFDALLGDTRLQALAFDGTPIIVQVVDISRWPDGKDQILSDVQRIDAVLSSHWKKATHVVFLHKVDLIEDDRRDAHVGTVIAEIRSVSDVEVYPTSIHPRLVHATHAAFSKLLGAVSERAFVLQSVLDTTVQDERMTGAFITNTGNAVIAQSFATDFDNALINGIHEIIGHINHVIDRVGKGDSIATMSIHSRLGTRIDAWYLDLAEFDLATIVIASSGKNDDHASRLLLRINEELRRRLYHES